MYVEPISTKFVIVRVCNLPDDISGEIYGNAYIMNVGLELAFEEHRSLIYEDGN